MCALLPFRPGPCGVQKETSGLSGPPLHWKPLRVGAPVFSPLSSSDFARDETPDTPGAPTAATAHTHTHTRSQNHKKTLRNDVVIGLTHWFRHMLNHTHTHTLMRTLVLFLSAFSSEISSSFSSSCSLHMFSSFVRVANSYKPEHTQ